MGSKHIDSNSQIDLFIGFKMINKVLDWRPPAGFPEVDNRPIHFRSVQDLSCISNQQKARSTLNSTRLRLKELAETCGHWQPEGQGLDNHHGSQIFTAEYC